MTEQDEARDPATPADRLLALLDSAPDAVLENPALLLLLEQPDFWERLSPGQREDVSRSHACPQSFVAWALGGAWLPQGVATGLLRNPAVPLPQRREAWLRRPLAEARLSGGVVAERPSRQAFLTEAERDLLDRAGWTLWATSAPSTSPMTEAELTQLRSLGPVGERLALRHPDCPGTWLEPLDPRAQADLLPWLVVHPRLSPRKLAGLLRSRLELKRLAVKNPSLSAAQQSAAARDPALRDALASNRGLPAAWVRRFLKDRREAVRVGLARNPALSPEVQLQLAVDLSPAVRQALLENPACTPEAQQQAEALRPSAGSASG